MAKSIKVPTQIILGFEAYIADAELYKKVAECSAEKFGKKSRAYQTIMNGIDSDKGTGSQFFFNTEAGLYLPKGQMVAKFDDLSRIYGADPSFFDGIYAVTSEIILRSDSYLCKNNSQILENLVKQIRSRGLKFSPDNPLVLSGLRLVRDDNKNNYYGLLLEMNESTIVANDSRFAYNDRRTNFRNELKVLLTQEDGLLGTSVDGSGSLGSLWNDLSDSGSGGRVVVFSDAEII